MSQEPQGRGKHDCGHRFVRQYPDNQGQRPKREDRALLNTTIDKLLQPSMRKRAGETALVYNDRQYNYAELDLAIDNIAAGLTGIGIGQGDRVTLYAQNSDEWVIAYFAVSRAGGVVNPINVMLTPEEVAYVVKDCGAKALITTAERGAPILSLKSDSDLNEIVCLGPDNLNGTVPYNDLLTMGAKPNRAAEPDPDDLAVICYTSGTTGHPKGAMLSHRNVTCSAAVLAAMNIRTAHDVQLLALPCAHVYGAAAMMGTFMVGGQLILQERFDVASFFAAVDRYRPTILDGVPTMYMLMLADEGFADHDFSALTRVIVGGQSMPVAKMAEWEERAGCPMFELWGMTELAGPGVMSHVYGENRHGSIGIACTGNEVRIGDAEDASQTMPNGEVGELMVKGPLVMMGYYGNEAATAETIEPDGWLHSGDLARQDDDGYVYIVDRKKDMIITGGYNVYPSEIERVVAGHPAVAMVGVGSKQDETKGEIAKAYVVLKPGVTVSDQEIHSYCREHLAAYKVPREVQFVDDLPKTSTGKIMRRELKTLEPTD